MALTYDTPTKTLRMQAVADQIDSHATLPGVLEIGTAAMATLLASFTLADPSGTVVGDTLTIDADPDLATTAAATGKAIEARITDGGGVVRVSGLTVGLTAAAAPDWTGTTPYEVGDFVTNGANQYVCTVAGTSDASGGPTGTGSGIVDGGVTWDYYSPAGAHLQFDSIQWTAGQALNILTGTITHAA